MKLQEFKKLIREETRKALIESAPKSGRTLNEDIARVDYAVLTTQGAEQQKDFDTEYKWFIDGLINSGELDTYMNKDKSFETREDFIRFNEGAIKYVNELLYRLKDVKFYITKKRN